MFLFLYLYDRFQVVLVFFQNLKNNFSKLKGFCITHGHEDHIGALPYILKQLNVPVYGTKLTCALIEKKLKEHQIDDTAKL